MTNVNPRTAIAAPDADISKLPHYDCSDASCIRLGAECTVAGKTLTCRVIFRDAAGVYAGTSMPVTFTSDPKTEDGAKFMGTPNIDPYFPVGGPSQFAIHVDAVSGGTWDVTAMCA